MIVSTAERVKTAFAARSPDEVLRARASVLLGVSEAAETALAGLDIRSVFDLAASRVFAAATRLLAAERDPGSIEARLNAVAADIVDAPADVRATDLARQSIAILRKIGPAHAADVAAALNAPTVRDLALWPPYLAARDILADAFFPERLSDFDLQAPADLLPQAGQYPTERVFYKKLLIDAAPPDTQGLAALEQSDAIDIVPELLTPTGFQRLATGALLTFSQSWYAQGLTLGQLLHSTSLAPGESTRIAMIDWSRRTRAATTEEISEAEQLANTADHTRALSEVTSATATEFQSGSSQSSATSTTKQSGGGFGLDLGPLGLGGSSSKSTTTTEAMSSSSSFGTRDLAGQFAQAINDRSQQHASAVRNRRASIVREVSQEEHEAISTRVVTNYNHMHALTVQYYEVVQAYRVTAQLERADRCLFVPLKLVSFRDAATVERLRPILAEAALTATAFRQLTSEYGVVEVIAQTPRITPGSIIVKNIERETAGEGGTPGRPAVEAGGATDLSRALPERTVGAERQSAVPYDRGPADASTAILAVKGWNLDQVNHLGWLTGRVPLRPDSDSVFVPDDATLLSVGLRAGQAGRFQIRRRDNSEVQAQESSATSFVLANPVPFAALQSIAIQNAADQEVKTSLVLSVGVRGSVVPLDVPIQLRPRPADRAAQEVVHFGNVRASGELVQHLEANRLHYSRAVFQTLDQAAIAGLLARFTYRALPLTQVVDPQPVAVTANFLVFRMNVPLDGEVDDQRFAEEQREWRRFLAARGLLRPAPKTEVVPLPSGGVFAEAVLGRFNSAEKIDLKRFWNWQDSPIPISAPEIAPVAAGSRAQTENLLPGQLGVPIVNLQSPTVLPGAAGVNPILSALQNGGMFRDMSGLAQTVGLAQSAAQVSGAGAIAAGDQAARNLFTVMDQHTQRLGIAADMLGSMMGGGAQSGGAGSETPAGRNTPTERGGQLAAAEDIDAKGSASAGGAAATATPGSTQQPASLQQQTLDQQSGTDAINAAEQVVDAATRPGPSTPPRRPIKKTSGGAAPTPGGGGVHGIPMDPASGTDDGSAASPGRYFFITIVLDDTSGIRLKGGASVRILDATKSTVVFEGSAGPEEPIRGGFVATGVTLHAEIRASARPSGPVLTGVQRIVLPPPGSGVLPDVFLTLRVNPVVQRISVKIPFATGTLFQPDTDAFAQMLRDRGITDDRLAADPVFELDMTSGYAVRVVYFTGMLIIKQIID